MTPQKVSTKPAPGPSRKLTEADLAEEAGWVEAAKSGDEAAFAHLVRRYQGLVRAFCARMLHPREVDDAVQQAFFEAWRSLPRFEGRSRFSTWLTRIAIHTSLGFRRRLKRHFLFWKDPAETEPMVVAFGRPQEDPEGALGDQRRREAVRQVLSRLSAKKRAVMVLSELGDLTAPEVAEILEIPEATVRTRIFHARRDFARLCRQDPHLSELFGVSAEDDGK